MDQMAADKKTVGGGHVAVHLEDGVIHHDYVGNQTRETLDLMVTNSDQLIEQLQAKEEPVLLLADCRRIGKVDAGARQRGRDFMGTRFFQKAAIFGLPPFLRVTASLIISLTGKGKQTKIFDTEAEARAWLNEN